MRLSRIAVLMATLTIGASWTDSVFAQETDDNLIQKWFFYDANRVDEGNLVEARFGIDTARAVLAYRKDELIRTEILFAKNAVSEEEYRLVAKDHKVASSQVDASVINTEIMAFKTAISNLRWRWHQGETRDIHVLEDLQFRLWDKQCDGVEIQVKIAAAELEFLVYRSSILRRLHERDATSLSELNEALTREAVKENQYRAQVEMFEGCKNGPPFDPVFELAKARKAAKP